MTETNYPTFLYKYLDYEGGKAMLEKETFQFTRAIKLNDPYDCFHTSPIEADYGDFSIDSDLNSVFSSIGICSLTDSPLNFLMWSYYNKHEAICLEINMKILANKIIGYHPKVDSTVFLKKVTYSDIPPTINAFDIVPQDFRDNKNKEEVFDKAQKAINTFLSTKAMWWENENEYRLILRQMPNDSSNTQLVIVRDAIKAVYMGNKIDDRHKRDILQIAKYRNLPVYQTLLKKNKYGLLSELIK